MTTTTQKFSIKDATSPNGQAPIINVTGYSTRTRGCSFKTKRLGGDKVQDKGLLTPILMQNITMLTIIKVSICYKNCLQ